METLKQYLPHDICNHIIFNYLTPSICDVDRNYKHLMHEFDIIKYRGGVYRSILEHMWSNTHLKYFKKYRSYLNPKFTQYDVTKYSEYECELCINQQAHTKPKWNNIVESYINRVEFKHGYPIEITIKLIEFARARHRLTASATAP